MVAVVEASDEVAVADIAGKRIYKTCAILTVMRVSLFAIAATLALGIPINHALAVDFSITPHIVDASSPVEEALARSQGHASTSIEGDGSSVVISYQSSTGVTVYVFPMHADHTYDPADAMYFDLSAGADNTATIDLTVSPGWHTGDSRYIVQILSPDKNPDVAFTDITFQPASWLQIILIPFAQFLRIEPFTPSTYHALRGYKFLGHAAVPVIAFMTIIVGCIVWFFYRKKYGIWPLVYILIIGHLVYGLRLVVDEYRFTQEHLTSWYTTQTYDEAESVFTIANSVQETAKTMQMPMHIFVCRDGTNFKEKLLRYMIYPISVSADALAAKKATHVILMNKLKWNIDNGILHCGDVSLPVKKMRDFSDGSILFSITSPQS